MTIKTTLEKPQVIILLIWIFLTAININKPFQGDDGFHLEAAQHIIKNPLRPMTGMIRWDHAEPEPIYNANQPPLLFYLMAGVALIGGFNEITMHLLTAAFSFLALFWFHKTTRLVNAPAPILLLLLFGLCPAFLVNQNIMTDIPLLALLMGISYYVLLGDTTGKRKYYLLAVLLLTAGLLIKYTFLSVFAALVLIFLLRKQYKSLLLLLIPVLALLLWSAWNYWEYGNIHLLQRSTRPKFSRWDLLWSYFSAIGSVAIFGIFSLNYLLKKKLGMTVVYSFTILFLLVAVFDYLSPNLENKELNQGLEILFFLNGLTIVLTAIGIVGNKMVKTGAAAFIRSKEATLFIIMSGISLFLILLAPFMATRHILLVIPFLLWLSAPAFQNIKKSLTVFSVAMSFIICLLLGISDWQFADYYRHSAQLIKKGTSPQTRIWSSGGGGWQWYTQLNGMSQYTPETGNPQPGDLLVIAKGLMHYRVEAGLKYRLLAQIWGDDITPAAYVSARSSSMYRTLWRSPSWTLSKKMYDTIYVLQFVDPQIK